MSVSPRARCSLPPSLRMLPPVAAQVVIRCDQFEAKWAAGLRQYATSQSAPCLRFSEEEQKGNEGCSPGEELRSSNGPAVSRAAMRTNLLSGVTQVVTEQNHHVRSDEVHAAHAEHGKALPAKQAPSQKQKAVAAVEEDFEKVKQAVLEDFDFSAKQIAQIRKQLETFTGKRGGPAEGGTARERESSSSPKRGISSELREHFEQMKYVRKVLPPLPPLSKQNWLPRPAPPDQSKVHANTTTEVLMQSTKEARQAHRIALAQEQRSLFQTVLARKKELLAAHRRQAEQEVFEGVRMHSQTVSAFASTWS